MLELAMLLEQIARQVQHTDQQVQQTAEQVAQNHANINVILDRLEDLNKAMSGVLDRITVLETPSRRKPSRTVG